MGPKDIEPAYSAQASCFYPNPKLEEAIQHLQSSNNDDFKEQRVVVQGSGKLRHLEIYERYFKEIFLVDTKFQLTRELTLFGEKTTVKRFIKERQNRSGYNYTVLTATEFEEAKVEARLLFNVNVLDVVTPRVRKQVLCDASFNLQSEGLGIFIVPRNDSSILKRCKPENKHLDGHIFSHHGTHTFFKNFQNKEELIEKLERARFKLIKDLSTYRQICFIAKKI